MARIRSIKPEFWTSEQVVELSPTARLLFVGMWTFCDDRGVHPASAKTLKMEVFPGDDFTTSDIENMMSEIIKSGLVLEYQAHDGKNYWAVTGWAKHQKVEKPNFKHPAPPDFADHSPTIRRPFADHSTPEGKGGEGKGREIEIEGKGGEVAETQPAPADFEKKEPTTPPLSQFESISLEIDSWIQTNPLEFKKICDAQKFTGNTAPEITRFITNNLAKDPYRARLTRAPIEFFLEQFPGWLCLPAAKKANKPQNGFQPQPGGYTKPIQRDAKADQHMSEPQALALIRQHTGEYANQFSTQHIESVRSRTSQRTAIELIHAIAKTIRDGPTQPRSNGVEISPHGLQINLSQ